MYVIRLLKSMRIEIIFTLNRNHNKIVQVTLPRSATSGGRVRFPYTVASFAFQVPNRIPKGPSPSVEVQRPDGKKMKVAIPVNSKPGQMLAIPYALPSTSAEFYQVNSALPVQAEVAMIPMAVVTSVQSPASAPEYQPNFISTQGNITYVAPSMNVDTNYNTTSILENYPDLISKQTKRGCLQNLCLWDTRVETKIAPFTSPKDNIMIMVSITTRLYDSKCTCVNL